MELSYSGSDLKYPAFVLKYLDKSLAVYHLRTLSPHLPLPGYRAGFSFNKPFSHPSFQKPMPQNSLVAQEGASQSSEALFTSILAHEQRFRGIDWQKELFDEAGEENPGFLEAKIQQLLQEALPAGQVATALAKGTRLRSGLRATDAETRVDTLLRFDEPLYKKYYEARDGNIKDLLLLLIQELQHLEKRLKSENFEPSLIWKIPALVGGGVATIGVIYTAAGVVGGIAAYIVAPAVATGITIATSLVVAIGVLLGAVVVLIAALIGMVLLMVKQASEIHLVLNNTDYELRCYEVYYRHGKAIVQPQDYKKDCIIPPRAVAIKRGYDQVEREVKVVYGGIFGMSKKDGALFGADGVIQFDLYDKAGNKHQTSTFLAYEVPLTGKNSCYVRCDVGNPSAEEFFKRFEDDIEEGHWEWTSESGNIKMRKRINGRSGSDCYAITTYEQV